MLHEIYWCHRDPGLNCDSIFRLGPARVLYVLDVRANLNSMTRVLFYLLMVAVFE